jgi:uncharacterized paraquat-inducible protein A
VTRDVGLINMNQQQISAQHGMPTANEYSCMNCDYDGHMVLVNEGEQLADCPQCDWTNPI